MFKKLLLVLLLVLTISGCTLFPKDTNKITLDSKYYNEGKYINVTKKDLDKLTNNNYILYVHNSFCAFKIPCETIFKKYMEQNKIDFLSINIDEYKKTTFYKKVKYAPTVLVVSKGKIVAFLDAESDDDINRYQDIDEFTKWIDNYVEKKA